MRIALTTETFLPKIDGIVTMLTKTVESLRARGDEVMVFAPSGGPAEYCGAAVVGMGAYSFPMYPELRLALPRRSMREKIREFEPDVLHLMEPTLLGIGGLYYARTFDIPTVVSYHTNFPAYLRFYGMGFLEGGTWRLIRERHKRADLSLCTSTAMVEELEAHGVERLALWERAVDAERFRPEAYCAETRRVLSGGETEKPLLLTVSRLSAEKDVADLRAVLDALPGVRLAVVGDGPVRGELERRFAGTGTYFAGYLRGDALAAAYASTDLFVLPSKTETLGLVLLEAMAAGCPVVACRAGGVPDAVEDGVTGTLYDAADPRGLVKAVGWAVENREQTRAMRDRALAEVQRHSWVEATERLRGLYREAMANRRPAPATEPQTVRVTGRLTRKMALGAVRWLLP